MTLNKQQSQLEQDELIQEAQKTEIEKVIIRNGPSTVAAISKELGLSPWLVREHCEVMRIQGDLNHNWITGRYSR